MPIHETSQQEMFAFCRSESIKHLNRLQFVERHGLRHDQLSMDNLRAGAEAGAGLDYPARENRHLRRSLTNLLKRHKAELRKNAPVAHHLLVCVSPSWVSQTGDLHDPDNPRNQLLFETAIGWVRSFAGPDSIVHARLDLDEEGGAVVDVILAPVHGQKYKNKTKTKNVVSTNKCLEALAVATGLAKGAHYQALQTSWARYAQEHLDPKLVRGVPKRATGREYLPVRLYKAEQEALKKAAEHDAAIEALNLERNQVAAERKDIEEMAEGWTSSLNDIFGSPNLPTLRPALAGERFQVPKDIHDAVKRVSPLWRGLRLVLTKLAELFDDLRTRTALVTRREAELQAALGRLDKVSDRLTTEEIEMVARVRATALHQDTDATP